MSCNLRKSVYEKVGGDADMNFRFQQGYLSMKASNRMQPHQTDCVKLIAVESRFNALIYSRLLFKLGILQYYSKITK